MSQTPAAKTLGLVVPAAGAPWRARAVAHPNLALVKYWGKRDVALNLPAVGSLSITLDTLTSHCEVAAADGGLDRAELEGEAADGRAAARIVAHLSRLIGPVGPRPALRVRCHNNFPTGAGLASSASGFAALTLAALDAAGRPPEDLGWSAASSLARMGSGSAGRSMFGGFVRQHRGQRADGADAVAEPLLDPQAWPLKVVIAVVSRARKAVGSSRGMADSGATSPFYAAWCDGAERDLAAAAGAIAVRDLAGLAAVAEHSCLKMHALMWAARPPLIYWRPASLAAAERVRALRAAGAGVFFTSDAGPQIKAVCEPGCQRQVAEALAACPGVEQVITCGLGPGARRPPDGPPRAP